MRAFLLDNEYSIITIKYSSSCTPILLTQIRSRESGFEMCNGLMAYWCQSLIFDDIRLDVTHFERWTLSLRSIFQFVPFSYDLDRHSKLFYSSCNSKDGRLLLEVAARIGVVVGGASDPQLWFLPR